ncbi:MAG TPA: hypothetical protein VFT83_01545 [Nitrososphaeraceae archaeon]|jgi:hypothetical protein|nr:hypothetical protein [Nitrososphaeraceae archaeon]
MPEIWLGYGSTHVVLDIKQENLLQFKSEVNLMSDKNIRNILTDIKLAKKTLLFPLSSSKHLLKIISLLIDISKSDNNIEIAIGAFSKDFFHIKSHFDHNKVFQINKKDFFEKINKFDNVVFISKISYDPLFGFSGSPSIITRNFKNDLMNDIFNSNEIISPLSGQIGEPLKMALEFYDKLSIHSIEILSNQHGISRIYYGNNSKSFKEAISDFKSNTILNIDGQKSLIISSGSEFDNHITLNESLYSLWNSIGVLKNQGTAVLLAENSNGLGNGALTMYLEGRLDLSEIKKTSYVNGLEHLVYLENLKDEYHLGLVSSIPFYYTKTKLGFNTYNNVKEVLENIMLRYGKSSKVMICPDPSITLFIKK